MTEDTRTDRQAIHDLAREVGAQVIEKGTDFVGFTIGNVQLDALLTRDIARIAIIKVDGNSRHLREGSDFRPWARRIVRRALREHQQKQGQR